MASLLLERDSHLVTPLPHDTAWESQSVVRYVEREASFDRNNADEVGKLDRRAGGGKIAHGAWVFVTAVLGDGRLVNGVPWSNPGFDHVK
jgi:hypothetical protein